MPITYGPFRNTTSGIVFPQTSLFVPSPRAVSQFTNEDPGSVSSAETQVGNYIQFALTNAATVSGLPNTSSSLTVVAKDILNGVADADIYDLLSTIVVYAGNDDPPQVDMRIGAFICNGLPSVATVGFGVTLTASGTDWIVGHLICAAGAWTNVAAAAADALTRGGRGSATHMTNSTQRSIRSCGLNASGLEINTVNIAASANTVAISDNLTHFGIFAGWATGVGGTPGNVLVSGYELLAKMSMFSGYGRPA